MPTDKPARPRGLILQRQLGRTLAAGRGAFEMQFEMRCHAGPDLANAGLAFSDMYADRLGRPHSRALNPEAKARG